MKTRLLGAACACAFTLATATVQAALLGRLPATPGGTDYQAYYDTTLNITWLADANLAASNTFGTSGCDFAYSGTDCGYNVQTGSASTRVYSEMASMFYDTLGNLGWYDTNGNGPQLGWGLTNTGPFANLQPNGYWSGLGYAPNTGFAWVFNFGNGHQLANRKGNDVYAWAVRPGDVVPVPAAVWLFGSGLIGLLGVARRKR